MTRQGERSSNGIWWVWRSAMANQLTSARWVDFPITCSDPASFPGLHTQLLSLAVHGRRDMSAQWAHSIHNLFVVVMSIMACITWRVLPGLLPAFRTASEKSWAWRPGNEARAQACQNWPGAPFATALALLHYVLILALHLAATYIPVNQLTSWTPLLNVTIECLVFVTSNL